MTHTSVLSAGLAQRDPGVECLGWSKSRAVVCRLTSVTYTVSSIGSASKLRANALSLVRLRKPLVAAPRKSGQRSANVRPYNSTVYAKLNDQTV